MLMALLMPLAIAVDSEPCIDGNCALPPDLEASGLSLLQTAAGKHTQAAKVEKLAEGVKMAPKKTSVIIMRHCVRTPGNDGIRAQPGFHTADDYASGKFPTFDAAANFCTPQGAKLVETQGKWIAAHNGIPLPVRAIGDHVARCKSTMDNFLKGFSPGLTKEQLSVTIDRLPFRWGKSPACEAKKLSDVDALKAQQDYIDANAPPQPEYKDAMRALFHLLGEGKAGDWTNIACTAGVGYGPSYPDPKVNRGIAMQPVGACQAATHLLSLLATEQSNNMTVAWDRIELGQNNFWNSLTTNTELANFGILTAYHDHVWFTNPTSAAWRAAALTKDVTDKLGEAEPGTTMYFGRKSNILELSGVLGLWWGLQRLNTTKTGSWLRLDREGDTISASYEFPFENEVGFNGSMTSVPAYFTKNNKSSMSFAEFKELGEKNSIAECAHGNECPNLPGCTNPKDPGFKLKPGDEIPDDEFDPDEDDA